jgi:8-amino-7-oxononanoate synthase
MVSQDKYFISMEEFLLCWDRCLIMNPMLKEYCAERIKNIDSAGLLRRLRSSDNRDGRTILINGNECINFSSNDYLGLSTHPQIKSLVTELSHKASGATASRLISGNHKDYEVLEKELAEFKRTEDTLVFSSGYAAAIGTIPALVGEGDFIVMDKLCHASLVDGARLSGATLRVFPHGNLKRCEELLSLCRKLTKSDGKILLITESVFSMDGDLAPLADLVVLKKKYHAWLMVDEAHATGLLGKNGRGGAEHFGVEGEVDISMGTLSKALPSVGGFIAGSKELKQYLINSARSFIFSTGLPPVVCRIATEAIRLIKKEPQIKASLWNNIRAFESLADMKIESPIIPWMIGEEVLTTKIAESLLTNGFFVPAVRYPTVAKGKARLRVSLSSSHTTDDVQKLCSVLHSLSSHKSCK